MDEETLLKEIETYFPEGLTCAVGTGSTRTCYILEKGRYSKNPGKIDDFNDYAKFTMEKKRLFGQNFFELGGKRLIFLGLIIPSFGLVGRNDDYQAVMGPLYYGLIDEIMLNFFRKNNIDPYFLNIESWTESFLPSGVQEIGKKIIEIKENWNYNPEKHRQWIYDLHIPSVHSMWELFQNLEESKKQELSTKINELNLANSNFLYSSKYLYEYIFNQLCNIKIPSPHFYMGGCTKGTFKFITSLSTINSPVNYHKLYFTPYPVFMTTRQSLKTILEDLVKPKIIVSKSKDYSEIYSQEQIQNEYERTIKLINDPESILGLSRQLDQS